MRISAFSAPSPLIKLGELRRLQNSKKDKLVNVKTGIYDKVYRIKLRQNELDSIRFRCFASQIISGKTVELSSVLIIS
jgi:hypothetical protein